MSISNSSIYAGLSARPSVDSASSKEGASGSHSWFSVSESYLDISNYAFDSGASIDDITTKVLSSIVHLNGV